MNITKNTVNAAILSCMILLYEASVGLILLAIALFIRKHFIFSFKMSSFSSRVKSSLLMVSMTYALSFSLLSVS